MKTHTLYRFFDREGRLLYVGITGNPWSRFSKHRDEKPWWDDIAHITMQRYGSREELAAAERVAIVSEKPIHNVMHNRRRTSGVAIGKPDGQPVWRCRCGKAITSKDDSIVLDSAQWKAAHDLERFELEQSVKEMQADSLIVWSYEDLMSMPPRGKWSILCDDCWDLGDSFAYLIEANRIQTWQEVAGWTAHMLGKNWFQFTNWSQLLYKAGAK